MKIDSYDVKASSQRSYLSVKSTSMLAKKAVIDPAKEQSKKDGEETAAVSISDAAKEMQEKLKELAKKRLSQNSVSSVAKTFGNSRIPRNANELKLSLLQMMIERLTGRKMNFKMYSPSDNGGYGNDYSFMGFSGSGTQNRTQVVDGWEVESFSYEAESVSYQAQGVIKTADGKTINVDINMYMSREFVSYSNVFVQSEKRACDPLVINYGGTAASLTGETFDFDLTMDGNLEKISVLGQGSGFLALDKNGDGKIGDGSELFGPSLGSGFEELRQYDGDGNGWIDENDEIFSKLVVWSRDKDGNDQMFTLKELDIGAIYLGDIDTEFSFKDDENQTTGIMRSTSFFLKESGGAGTISHVDMMV